MIIGHKSERTLIVLKLWEERNAVIERKREESINKYMA